MHLQQCSVITTQSQQASSHLDCKRKSPPNKITDFHSGRRKCHKNDTHSDTNMKRNAVKHAHALCDNWHPHKWRTVCTTTVLSVRARCVVCLFAFACMCQQYLSHSFHSSDSFGRLCLRISKWSRRNVGVTTDGYSFFTFIFFFHFDTKNQNSCRWGHNSNRGCFLALTLSSHIRFLITI